MLWRLSVSMRQAYGTIRPSEGHHIADRTIVTLAVVTALAVRWGRSSWLVPIVLVVAIAAAVALAPTGTARPGWVVAILASLVVFGAWRSDVAWGGLADGHFETYEGWVQIVDDPQPYAGATRVIVEIDGQRYESWHRGRAATTRAGRWRAGERVAVSGTRRPLDDERRTRVAWQHVVGAFELDWASDVDPGRPVDRASNRLRSAIERRSVGPAR